MPLSGTTQRLRWWEHPPLIEYFQQSVMYGSCTRLITNYELRITNYFVLGFFNNLF